MLVSPVYIASLAAWATAAPTVSEASTGEMLELLPTLLLLLEESIYVKSTVLKRVKLAR